MNSINNDENNLNMSKKDYQFKKEEFITNKGMMMGGNNNSVNNLNSNNNQGMNPQIILPGLERLCKIFGDNQNKI